MKSNTRSATAAEAVTQQFLTFRLGEEEYGVPILEVREIRGYSAPTPIPNTPHFIRGVINLRGQVVPVVDLRAKFSMRAVEYGQFTVVVIVNVGNRTVGLVVDAVSDVLSVGPDTVEPPPNLGQGVDMSFLLGMAKTDERLVLLLDSARLISAEQLTQIELPAA
jgi:purine-binding chemotaxis protein CheW